MWTGDKFFYDLLSSAVGDKANLQAFVDAFADKYNKLDTAGFSFRPEMQAGFGFEQIQRDYGINAMATYVDLDSAGTPISYEGETLDKGNIPRAKKRADFDENDYRQKLIMSGFGQDMALASQRTLFEANKKLIDAHTNALTYQRHQMVSRGQFVLTSDNNAGGIEGVVYKANLPKDNVVTVKNAWWSDDSNEQVNASATPIADLKGLAKRVKQRGGAYHWEVDKTTLDDTLAHDGVLTAIGYNFNPLSATSSDALAIGKNLGDDELVARLSRLIGFPIKVVDSISRVDKINPKTRKVEGTDIRSFEPNVWALIPDGQIGEILTVAPLRINPSDTTAYASYYGGRLLMTFDYDIRRKIQYIETEMTALVVPDRPKQMYILKVK